MKKNSQKQPTTNYTCNEYREEMILLGLRKQLQDPKLSDNTKKELLKEIEQLEKTVGI